MLVREPGLHCLHQLVVLGQPEVLSLVGRKDDSLNCNSIGDKLLLREWKLWLGLGEKDGSQVIKGILVNLVVKRHALEDLEDLLRAAAVKEVFDVLGGQVICLTHISKVLSELLLRVHSKYVYL